MQLRHGMPWVKAGREVACALAVFRKIDGKWRVAKEASIRSNAAYKRVLG